MWPSIKGLVVCTAYWWVICGCEQQPGACRGPRPERGGGALVEHFLQPSSPHARYLLCAPGVIPGQLPGSLHPQVVDALCGQLPEVCSLTCEQKLSRISHIMTSGGMPFIRPWMPMHSPSEANWRCWWSSCHTRQVCSQRQLSMSDWRHLTQWLHEMLQREIEAAVPMAGLSPNRTSAGTVSKRARKFQGVLGSGHLSHC